MSNLISGIVPTVPTIKGSSCCIMKASVELSATAFQCIVVLFGAIFFYICCVCNLSILKLTGISSWNVLIINLCVIKLWLLQENHIVLASVSIFRYLDKFTEFIHSFVQSHLRRFENSLQFPINDFLALLYKYTFGQPRTDGYMACLDIWYVNRILKYTIP